MNTPILSLAGALALTIGGAALAQPTVGPATDRAAAYLVAPISRCHAGMAVTVWP